MATIAKSGQKTSKSAILGYPNWHFLGGAISQKGWKSVIFLFFYFEVLDMSNVHAKYEQNPYGRSLLKWASKWTLKNGLIGSPTLELG